MMQNSLKGYIKITLQLSKVRITIAVSLTTITGYILAGNKFDYGIIPVTLGIFLLACGASVMNHIQEQRTDALMQRTEDRPLPMGKVSRKWAFMLFLIETLAGSLILYLAVSPLALVLGWLAFIWYNVVYTYLKRITPHAVIPGSLIGAMPPLIGWVASGGLLIDFRAWVMAIFFFVWQVPHFYLLVMKYGTQYEKAGMPTLTNLYSQKLIMMIVFLWVIATGFSALLLYYFRLVHSFTGLIIVSLASLWIITVFFVPLVKRSITINPFRYFMRINYYVLLVILILIFDHQLVKYFI